VADEVQTDAASDVKEDITGGLSFSGEVPAADPMRRADPKPPARQHAGEVLGRREGRAPHRGAAQVLHGAREASSARRTRKPETSPRTSRINRGRPRTTRKIRRRTWPEDVDPEDLEPEDARPSAENRGQGAKPFLDRLHRRADRPLPRGRESPPRASSGGHQGRRRGGLCGGREGHRVGLGELEREENHSPSTLSPATSKPSAMLAKMLYQAFSERTPAKAGSRPQRGHTAATSTRTRISTQVGPPEGRLYADRCREARKQAVAKMRRSLKAKSHQELTKPAPRGVGSGTPSACAAPGL
jgi:hypothetical protein